MHAKVWVSIVQVERSNNKKINQFSYLANDFHNGRKRRKFIFETLIKISNTSTSAFQLPKLNLQTRYHLLLLQIQFIRFTTRRQAPSSSSKLDTRTTQPACCMPGGRWAAMLAAIWLAIAGEMPMFIMAAGLRPWNCGRPGGAECREWGSPRGCPGIDIGLIAGGSCGIFWTVKIIKFSHHKTTSAFIEQFFDCFRSFVYLSGLGHIVAFGVANLLLEG